MNENRQQEALRKLKGSTELTITPAEAADVIGCAAQSIRIQAREDPSKLGFNVIQIGGRTIIPRIPFIQYFEGSVS